jgi:hypothetical protein
MRYLALLLVLLTLTSCAGEADAPLPADLRPSESAPLGGVWQSADDAASTLELTDGRFRERYDGEAMADESFEIVDSCDGSPEVEAGYLSVGDGRCFALVEVSDQVLVLSYVGRGNTLRYVRADATR